MPSLDRSSLPIHTAGLSFGLLAIAASSQAGILRSWAAPVDGSWSVAANWSPAGVPTATDTAELALDGAYIVSLNDTLGVGALSITNPSATLGIANFRTLTVADSVHNDGTIIPNNSVNDNPSRLAFNNPIASSITGSGTIQLTAATIVSKSGVHVAGTGTVTHASTHRIRGAGQILGGSGGFINHGVIAADQPGSQIELTGLIMQSPTGLLLGDGGQITLNGGTLIGGIIDTDNNGLFLSTGSSTIDGVTILGEGGINNFTTLSIGAGGIHNLGTLTVNQNAGANATSLRAIQNTAITGGGTTILNALPGIPAGARLGSESGVVLTIAPEHTVEALNGQIFGELINHGLIIARGGTPGAAIVQAEISQSGTGTIRAEDGFATIGGGTVLGGTLDSNAGGIVTVTGGGSTIGAVTNSGNAAVENFATLLIQTPGITNNGTLTVNRTAGVNATSINAVGPITIGGTGTIVLNGGSSPATARINAPGGTTISHGADHRITMTIGQLSGEWNNAGTIAGNAAGPGGTSVNATITQSGGGRLLGDGGFLSINGGLIIGGSIDTADNGIVTASGGGAVLNGVTNLGNLAVENFAAITLSSSGVVNNGSITVNRVGGGNATMFRAAADASILGSGTVLLNAASPALSTASFGSSSSGVTLTIGPGQTIRGNGQLTGTIVCAGTLSPSGPLARFATPGSLAFLAGGALRIGLEEPGIVPRLIGGNPLDIAQATLIIGDDGFAPDAFFRATISAGPVYSGRFSGLQGDPLTGGRIWRVVYVGPTTIDIAATCAADFNADGAVDADDLGILLGAFGQTGITPFSGADANGDGSVDADDLGVLLGSFGNNC